MTQKPEFVILPFLGFQTLLRAGNFSPEQAAAMAKIIRARIRELVNLAKE